MLKLQLAAAGKLRLRSAVRLAAFAAAAGGSAAATAIAVTDVPARLFKQRGVAGRTMMIAGTYAGPAASIKARFAPVGTALSATLPAWTVIDAAPAGGAYSQPLALPDGGPYVIQVQDGAAAVSAQGVRWISAGPIVGLLGQSLMADLFEGNSQTQGYALGARGAQAWRGAWVRVGNTNDSLPPGTMYPGGYTSYTPAEGTTPTGSGLDGDGLTLMLNSYVAASALPMGAMPYAVGGSRMSEWQPSSGVHWATWSAAVAAAGGEVEGLIWSQGESADSGETVSSWLAGLANVHAGAVALSGRSQAVFRFGMAIMGPCTDGWSAGTRQGLMRLAQLNYAKTTTGAFVAAPQHDLSLADMIHPNVAGQVRTGYRFAEAWRRKDAGSPYDMRGPEITGATRVGATVTVPISHNGGTALVDGAGGAGVALLGFRYFDSGGAAVAITGTSIAGNAVVLTLASAVAGTLDYAMVNAPYGSATPAAAAIVYDNQTVPGDSVGLPLQPHAAMAVA